jgi:hypothetical protein
MSWGFMSRRKAVLEKLLDVLPGFKGYRRREYVREDDRLIREHIVKILMDAVRSLEDSISMLVEYDYKAADLYNEILRDLRLVMDRVKWAEYGYAPHFNIFKIDLGDLEKMKEIDGGLVDDAEKILDFIGNLKKDVLLKNPVRDKAPELIKLIDEFKQLLGEREKVIRGWME